MATTQKSRRSSERVEPEAFSRRVAEKLGDRAEVQVRHGNLEATVATSNVVDVVRTLRTDPEIDCNFFTFLSAVDWQDEGFEVLIAVFSIRFENTVIVKVRLPADDPRMPSLTAVYGGANWHERETHEMFGIAFDGHPNLVKLYLPEDFEGFPLRKSFKLASRTYKPWPGAKDPDEAAGGGRA